MKKQVFRPAVVFCALAIVLSLTTALFAKVEWEILKDITLADDPRDIAIASDGSTAYILCSKSVQIYSTQEKKVTGSIPLEGDFSQIAVAPSGEELFLTKTAGKQLSVIKVSQVYDIPVSTSPVIGKAGAPVTIFAFLDYQWPYCSRIFPELEQLLKKYPNDANLVIKHFPLQMHKFAEKASLAALAAAEQGKYQEFSSALLKDFNNLSDQTITKHAEAVGLNMEKFDAARNNPALKKQIQEDLRLGSSVKVRGVPSIFINGRMPKQRSLDGFSQMIEEELKK